MPQRLSASYKVIKINLDEERMIEEDEKRGNDEEKVPKLFVRQTTNGLVFFGYQIGKEMGEHALSNCPITAIDAVFHLGWVNLSLDEPCLSQFLEMLGDSCLGNRQLLMDGTEITTFLLCQEAKDGNACGMRHCFGKSCQLSIDFLRFLWC